MSCIEFKLVEDLYSYLSDDDMSEGSVATKSKERPELGRSILFSPRSHQSPHKISILCTRVPIIKIFGNKVF